MSTTWHAELTDATIASYGKDETVHFSLTLIDAPEARADTFLSP
jgi:hypothetical protein